MNSNELTLIICGVLFAAFVTGWILRWAYSRLNKVNTSDMAEVDDLANRLYEAEQAKDNAEAQMRNSEWELNNKLGQAEAELAAAMEGLGAARREAEELRAQLGQ